jgi:hypothetical protein
LFQNRFLSMHVCKATIQDNKKNISKILSFFLIYEKKKSEKWQGFLSKTSIFRCSTKFDQNNFFQKFKKNLVRKRSKQQKMAIDIDLRAPGGRESLWTTGEKTGFLRVHCEVPEQPNLDFSFEGFNIAHSSSLIRI